MRLRRAAALCSRVVRVAATGSEHGSTFALPKAPAIQRGEQHAPACAYG